MARSHTGSAHARARSAAARRRAPGAQATLTALSIAAPAHGARKGASHRASTLPPGCLADEENLSEFLSEAGCARTVLGTLPRTLPPGRAHPRVGLPHCCAVSHLPPASRQLVLDALCCCAGRACHTVWSLLLRVYERVVFCRVHAAAVDTPCSHPTMPSASRWFCTARCHARRGHGCGQRGCGFDCAHIQLAGVTTVAVDEPLSPSRLGYSSPLVAWT